MGGDQCMLGASCSDGADLESGLGYVDLLGMAQDEVKSVGNPTGNGCGVPSSRNG